MLQKLKLKLVAVNVALLTVVLIAVFVTAYFLLESQLIDQEITLLNKVVYDEIGKPLEWIDTVDFPEPESENKSIIADGWENIDFQLENEEYFLPLSSSRQMFYIKLFMDDETVSVSSNIIPEKTEDVIYLMTKVDETDRSAGDIDMSGRIKLAFRVEEGPNIRVYAFIERETREETMSAYIFVAFVALFGSVICVFIISVYMAGRAIKPVKESLDRQEKFIADASHELRTPIAIIRSNTELIMDSPWQKISDNMKWLDYIHQEAMRMTRMTEELLLLSRADAKIEVPKENLNLSVLVAEVYDSFNPLFEGKKITAGGADIEQDIYIYANELGIRRLATIFLDNAVKYTKEGGSVSVRLEKDKSGASVYLKVIDTGIGMPKEMCYKIFERFFRIDKARSKSTGGFGLGLSIAKAITDEHNGEITVESEEGKGSEFCVRLPVAEQ